MGEFKILFVDDEEEYRDIMNVILNESGYSVETADSAEEALIKINENSYDLIVSDLIMGNMDGIDLLKMVKSLNESIEVIILTGYGSIENAVLAMKEGAFSYFIKSHDPDELIEEIEKLKELKKFEEKNMKNEKSRDDSFDYFMNTGNSKYKKMLNIAEKAAKSNLNILITGESGVGKEVVAKYIHMCSERKDKKFVAVNCPSFTDTLLESELFGYERGSFTGAIDSRMGRFEYSKGGTIFLDEIGDMSMNAQSKLLRVVETKSIERIGSNKSFDVDFRLISATNCDLTKSIEKMEFRADLFYRISTISINIPPLRERIEDIEDLTEFFIDIISSELNKSIFKVSSDVKEFLKNYNFPGNVRELKNIIERLIVLTDDGILRKNDLPDYLCLGHDRSSEFKVDGYSKDEIIQLKDLRKEVEAKYIKRVLELYNYNVTESAKKLGIGRRQLFNKISEYNLR